MAFASTAPYTWREVQVFLGFLLSSVTSHGSYCYWRLYVYLSVVSVKIRPVWGELIRVPPAVSEMS